MSEKKKITIETHSGLGLIWFAGWLFSIDYLQLGLWKGLIALVVWPYLLGAHVAGPAG